MWSGLGFVPNGLMVWGLSTEVMDGRRKNISFSVSIEGAKETLWQEVKRTCGLLQDPSHPGISCLSVENMLINDPHCSLYSYTNARSIQYLHLLLIIQEQSLSNVAGNA